MDSRLARKGEHQHGVIRISDATSLGVGLSEIAQLVRRHDLVPLRRGLYRIAGAPQTWEQRVVAAYLASAGPIHTAAVAYRTAAAWHGFHGYERAGRPILCTPRGGSSRNSLAVIVTCTDLRAKDCCAAEPPGLLLTNPTRTVLDLSLSQRSRPRLDRLLDRSLLDKRTTIAELWEVLLHVADRGKKGVVIVRAALADRSGDYVPVESELEHLAVDALHVAGLPAPERQHPLPGAPFGRVDLAYPDARLIVELDGAQHRLPESRRADYERDIAAARAGWMVLRFDWSHLRFRPGWFAASVEAVRRQRM